MAPKRKAAAAAASNTTLSPDPLPLPKKRATRSSGASEDSKTVAVASSTMSKAPATTTAKSKTKKVPIKKQEEQDEEAQEEHQEEEEEEEKPAPKKGAAASRKTTTAAKGKSKTKETKPVPSEKKKATASTKAGKGKQAKAAEPAHSPVDVDAGSTSTTPLPELGPPAASPANTAPNPLPVVKKKKPASWEEGIKEWFAEYADQDDSTKIGGEGIERLFEDMGVGMEGAAPFILAWKLDAKPGTFGSYDYEDFYKTFKEPKIYDNEGLKAFIQSSEKQLYNSSTPSFVKKLIPISPSQQKKTQRWRPQNDWDEDEYYSSDEEIVQQQEKHKMVDSFEDFYLFLFPFIKEEGQKSLAGEMAIALWTVALAPKYKLAASFVEYTTSLGSGFKGVSTDVWSQLLEFVKSTSDDLHEFNEMDAWPSIIDTFVEWKKEKMSAA